MESAADVWEAVLKIIGTKLTSTAMSTWFDNCEAIAMDESEIVLYTPSKMKREIISTRYDGYINDALRELFSGDFSFKMLSESEMAAYRAELDGYNPNPFDGSQFTFERFVVGGSNRFAHAAAIAVSKHPATAYNPLFIYGESGLGKTHLLYAIGHELRQTYPKFKIVYVKGDDFTNELIGAIQTSQNAEFREKYRTADLLLVDDIQFIAGKVQTQEEFFHTFNTLYESGKQIVLTSDRPPREMLRLEDRLRTRFEWGILADIQPPDYETRVAIIKNKALRLGVTLPDKICTYIAENITTNVRQIEGTVKKIAAYRDLLDNTTIDMELVERITKDIIRDAREYTPEMIIETTATAYGIDASDVTGKSRVKQVALARQVSMYLMRKLTDLPLTDIGNYYGNKDHSTVIHAIRKVEDAMAADPQLADRIRDITSNITNKT